MQQSGPQLLPSACRPLTWTGLIHAILPNARACLHRLQLTSPYLFHKRSAQQGRLWREDALD
jgi:hypothetical protein